MHALEFKVHFQNFAAGHIHALSLAATAFSLIGKMASSGTFSAVFLYTPEIYPTNYRYIRVLYILTFKSF